MWLVNRTPGLRLACVCLEVPGGTPVLPSGAYHCLVVPAGTLSYPALHPGSPQLPKGRMTAVSQEQDTLFSIRSCT